MAASERLPGFEATTYCRPGWSCPGCGVNYSPDVEACYCAAVRPPAESLADRLAPTVISFPRSTPPSQWVPPFTTVQGDATCTCPPMWGAIIPPPPCPAHGQAYMVKVTC